MKHELDLLGNALDSLNEGLKRYRDGRDGETRAYKFAVLHCAHFAELLFKEAVARLHPLLIYREPYAGKLTATKTITLWDGIRILRNAGTAPDTDLVEDLEWLKGVRNDIEHHRFAMNVLEIRAALGRIIRAAKEFAEELDLPNFADELDQEGREVLETLLDEYKERVANARADASAEPNSNLENCWLCGEQGVAAERVDLVHCYFCGEDDRFEVCTICQEPLRRSELTGWNGDSSDHTSFACETCVSHIFRHDD
jgi:hypothetical protein